MVDVQQFGRRGIGAAYIVSGRRTALIDTGTSVAVDRIVHAMGARKPSYILLTHVHPDHAGGASLLADLYPEALVGVHRKGLAHLVDPSRLNESILRVTGGLASHYGEVRPLARRRLVVLDDGERVDLGGGCVLVVVDTPGHAPHHLCFFEPTNRALFCGDALGVNRTGEWIPASVPPSFDLLTAVASLRRLRGLNSRQFLLAHFGAVETAEGLIRMIERRHAAWVRWIRALMQRHPPECVEGIVVESQRYASLPGVLREEIRMFVRGTVFYQSAASG